MLGIVRYKKTDKGILGRLYLNGVCICYTAENPTKAIPCGFYHVKNSQSPKFKRELPLVFNEDVPASRGIRAHRGNDPVKDSQGCVLVGMGIDEKNSRLTESAMAESMVTALCRNVSDLVITEL